MPGILRGSSSVQPNRSVRSHRGEAGWSTNTPGPPVTLLFSYSELLTPRSSILPASSSPALQSPRSSRALASFLASDQRSSLAQPLLQPFILPAFMELLSYKGKSSRTSFPPPSPRGPPFLPAHQPSLPQPRCPQPQLGDPAARPITSLPFGGLAPTRFSFKNHAGAEGKESFARLRVLRLKTQRFRPWSIQFLDQDKLLDLFLALREQNESPAQVPPSPLQTKGETASNGGCLELEQGTRASQIIPAGPGIPADTQPVNLRPASAVTVTQPAWWGGEQRPSGTGM